MYEFVKPRHQWSTTSQACFVAGMEYAMAILEDRAKYDGLPDIDLPPLSDSFKSIANIHYSMKTVDKYLDPLIKSGSIKE